jgi:multiple sugar transport system substrate-binding protein
LRTWLAAVCALLVAMTAACQSGASTTSSGPVTLTFWNGFSDADRPNLEALVSKFNSSQSKVKVEMTITKWDVMFQKLLPAYAAGTGPDIVAMDTQQLPGYASKGVFAPLDDFYSTKKLPVDQMITSAPKASLWNGKQYGVPMSFGTANFYWNKDMFAKAGLDPESPPKTWDEWAADAQKLTIGGANPTQYGVVFPETQAVPVWAILLWGNGGGVVSPDGKQAILGNPDSVQAVDFWSKLVLDKHISPIGLTGVDADKLMQSGKAAMMVNGPWAGDGLTQAKINYGLGKVPAGPKAQATIGICIAMALNARADASKKAAAAQFFSFWNSKETQTFWSLKTGWPPTRSDIPASDLASNPNISKFMASSEMAQFYLAGVPKFAQINDTVFVPTIQKILNKAGSPAQLLPPASQEIQALLGSS